MHVVLLYHKCPSTQCTPVPKRREETKFRIHSTLTCIPTDECSTPHRSPEHIPDTQTEPHLRPRPLDVRLALDHHRLPRARDRMRQPERTRDHPLGSCVRRAVRTTSGYLPSKNAMSRAAALSTSVSAAICSGGGSGNSSGFFRISEVSRTCTAGMGPCRPRRSYPVQLKLCLSILNPHEAFRREIRGERMRRVPIGGHILDFDPRKANLESSVPDLRLPHTVDRLQIQHCPRSSSSARASHLTPRE